MRKLNSDHALRFSAAWLGLWFGAGLVQLGIGYFHPERQNAIQLSRSLAFGFDVFGRNLVSITLSASMTSIGFALAITLLSCLAGLVIGSAVASGPKPLHVLLRRSLDALLSFPPLLFGLGWAALRGPGWSTLAFALLIGSVPQLIRLTFARSREVLHHDYVLASRGLGASSTAVLARHVLPASFSLCMIKAPNVFAHALIAEATLSFLGIGAPIGYDTWGSLLLQGRSYLIEAPHIALAAGFPLVLTVLAMQVLSERLSRHFSENWL